MTATMVYDHDTQALLEQASAGFREAMDALVRQHIDFVYASARRQVADSHAAEDVTQAVFLLLMRKVHHLARRNRGTPMLRGWLHITTRYVVQNQLKAQRRRAFHERSAAAAEQVAREMSDPVDQAIPFIDEALARLGERDRQAVLMRFYDRLSLAEVGQAMGISVEAASKRVSRAVARLGKIISRHADVAVPSAAIVAMLDPSRSVTAPPGLVDSIARSLVGQTAGGLTSIWTSAKLAIGATVATVSASAVVVVALLQGTGAAPAQTPAAATPPVVAAAPATVPTTTVTTIVIRGQIQQPDGKPAAGAQVLIASGPIWHSNVFDNDLKSHDKPRPGNRPPNEAFATADEQGQFQIPLLARPFRIIVSHDSGCAEVSHAEFAEDAPIKLHQWARIEGRVPMGGKPRVGEVVTLTSTRLDVHMYTQGPGMHYYYRCVLDKQGNFAIPRVRPMWFTIAREGGMRNAKFVEGVEGKTTQTSVGGFGRSVKGHVLFPDGKTFTDFTVGGLGNIPTIGVIVRGDPDGREIPKEWGDAIVKQVEAWSRQQRMPQRTADDSVRYAWEASLYISIKPDGSFEAADVPAGHYTLEVGDSSGSDQERKTYFHKPIDVLAVEADDQPLDVGDLQMVMPPPPKAGQRPR